MGNLKGKSGFPLLIFMLLFLLFSSIFPAAAESADSESGEFRVGEQRFLFHKNSRRLDIYDCRNRPVFSSSCREGDNQVILNFGYSRIFHSFFVFKQKIQLQPVNYELNLEFENFSLPAVIRSDTAFYTPVLGEIGDNIYLIYIGEDFSIRVSDPKGGRLLHTVRSDTPVIKLSPGNRGGRDTVEFYRFAAGKYREHFFYLDDVESGRIDFLCLEPGKEKESAPVQSEIILDEQKFIGFGDSITVGKIGSVETPELGYIPRLQSLLRARLYADAEVINEGISATQTWEAMARIEAVVLTHLGKYLLFHYGTNDVIHTEIPVSAVLFNIEYMMVKTLQYNVQPILTTLIPRNTKGNVALFRERGLVISEGIQELALSMDIPVMDLWELFLYYPDSDGGYMSLMSDHVHPSEKGYQLMAEEWLSILLAFPPHTPAGVGVLNRSGYQVTVQWRENMELDVVEYLIRFGYSPSRLSRTSATSTSYYQFIYNPLFSPFHHKVYFQVRAVDSWGNESEFTPVHEAGFNEPGGSFPPAPPIGLTHPPNSIDWNFQK